MHVEALLYLNHLSLSALIQTFQGMFDSVTVFRRPVEPNRPIPSVSTTHSHRRPSPPPPPFVSALINGPYSSRRNFVRFFSDIIGPHVLITLSPSRGNLQQQLPSITTRRAVKTVNTKSILICLHPNLRPFFSPPNGLLRSYQRSLSLFRTMETISRRSYSG